MVHRGKAAIAAFCVIGLIGASVMYATPGNNDNTDPATYRGNLQHGRMALRMDQLHRVSSHSTRLHHKVAWNFQDWVKGLFGWQKKAAKRAAEKKDEEAAAKRAAEKKAEAAMDKTKKEAAQKRAQEDAKKNAAEETKKAEEETKMASERAKQAAEDKAKAADEKARKKAEAKEKAALLEKEKAVEAEKVAEEDEKTAIAAKSSKYVGRREQGQRLCVLRLRTAVGLSFRVAGLVVVVVVSCVGCVAHTDRVRKLTPSAHSSSPLRPYVDTVRTGARRSGSARIGRSCR